MRAPLRFEYRCLETGLGCNWKARGATREDVIFQATQHMRGDHSLMQIPDDLELKIESSIRELPSSPSKPGLGERAA